MPYEQLLDDERTWLTALEQRALGSVRRHGIARFVLIQTLAAIAVSVLLVTFAWWALDGFHDTETWGYALALSALVPAIVAPPLITFCARLIARLEATRRLLRASSVTDPLTGVPNRRGFFEELERIEPASPTSVTGMVDIDSFKSLNDAHGHAFGDRALIAVADWLRSLVGDGGLVGRLGGDEFAFVTASDRIVDLDDRQRFELDGVGFSASLGLAHHDRDRTASALHEADVALYRVKHARNNVDAL